MNFAEFMLKPEQLAKLRAAAEKSRLSEADTNKVIDWAAETCLRQGILDNVIAGAADVHIDKDGEICFSLSKQGMRKAEDLIAESKKEK